MYTKTASQNKLLYLQQALVIFTIICCTFYTHAQINKDSLWNIWSDTSKPDTARLKSIHTIAKSNEYKNNKPDSAFYFAQLQYDFAKKVNNTDYMAKANNTKGVVNMYKGNFSEALDYFDQALQFYETDDDLVYENIDNLKGKGIVYKNLGAIYYFKSDFDKAMDYFLKSAQLSKQVGDKSTYAKTIGNIGAIYLKKDELEKAIEFFERSLKLAEELDNKKLIASNYNNLANVYNDGFHEYDKAIEYYNKSIDFSKKIDDTNNIALCYRNIGLIYSAKGNYSIALEHYIASLEQFKKIKRRNRIGSMLMLIGNIFYDIKDYDKAYEYINQSYELNVEIGNKYDIAASLISLGSIAKGKGNIDNALDYYEKALKICIEIENNDGLISSFTNIGKIHYNRGNYELALTYYFKSLKIATEINDEVLIAKVKYRIGHLFYKQQLYPKAYKYLSEALEIGERKEDVEIIKNTKLSLYQYYYKTRQYKLAVETYDNYITLRDSLNSEKNQREIISLEYKYQYDKKVLADSIARVQEKLIANTKAELQQTQLDKKKNQNLYLLGLVVLLLVFSGFIYHRFKIINRQKIVISKQRKSIMLNLKKMEEKNLRKQMNPHFIFNTINNIQYFMFLKGERETNKYFGYFSKLIRYTLDKSNAENTSLHDEIEYLRSYINLEKMRMDDNLNATINIDPNLNLQEIKIPCMLIQPMIENAILHGLKPKKSDRELMLQFTQQNTHLHVKITDNGIGREAAAEKKINFSKKRRSWATYILKERITIFNTQNDAKITFNITDLKTEHQAAGTQVNFQIPIIPAD